MSNDSCYDVIMVGGGLAGLSAAALLSKKGHRVLVLEKEYYPKHKVCGEYISMESKPFLERLGVPVSSMNLPGIKKLQVTDAAGRELNIPLPQGGFGISRYQLDAKLAEAAENSGAILLTKTRADDVQFDDERFTVMANGRAFTAGVVCGAWGKRSNLDVKWQRPFIAAKRKALNNYVGIKYHVHSGWPGDCVGLHNFSNGYCGISPIEDNKYCLCYLTTAANLQQCGNDIKEMEQQVLAKNPALKRVFDNARFLYDSPLAISQISFQEKEQVHNHTLLLGDASGMITPLCGNGMSIALHSAALAANHIGNFLAGKISRLQMEQGYSKTWARTFSGRLSLGRFIQGNFGKQGLTSLLFMTLYRLPFLQRALIQGTSGKPF